MAAVLLAAYTFPGREERRLLSIILSRSQSHSGSDLGTKELSTLVGVSLM